MARGRIAALHCQAARADETDWPQIAALYAVYRRMAPDNPLITLNAAVATASLHAATRVAAWDRRGLERLCRYGARGAVANSRLSELADGRFRYELKRPLHGRTEMVLTGVELVRKLAALVPPPRANLTRYHGVFAPGSKLRARVVPAPREAPRKTCARQKTGTFLDVLPRPKPRPRGSTRYRLDWATLFKKVFGVDVLPCERCGGRMRLIAQLSQGDATRKILRHLALPDSPLPLSPSRGPPADELWS